MTTSRSLCAQTPRVTFSATQSADLQVSDPAGRVAGDFNQDGHVDLIVTAKGAPASNVRVLIGDGSGGLSHASPFSFTDATAMASADFDGDGSLDVAITQDVFTKGGGYGDRICGSLVGIAIFLGPTMSSARCIATVPRAVAIQSADFDGDGRPDIALVSGSGQGLLIYSRLDFINSSVSLRSVSGGNVYATSMAPPIDLNGDGIVDLVIGHAAGIVTLLGNGDGSFRAGGVAGATSRQAVAIGDVNRDRIPDILSVDSASGLLFVAAGAGDGTFTSGEVASLGPDLSDIAVADIDADGHDDAIVAQRSAGAVRILFGSGDGRFADALAITVSPKPRFVTIADWDEDGDLDLAIVEAAVTGRNAFAWIVLQDGGIDRNPPAVTVPGDTTLQATGPDGAAFTYTATAIDNRDGPLVPACTPPSGGIFPIGATTVSCSATDSAGNVGSASFVVTVVRPPILVTSISAAPSAPIEYGTPITWTTTARGGLAPLEYQYWRYSYGARAWTLARSYSTDPSFSWTPGSTDTGAYNFQVWIRSAGSPAPFEAHRDTGVYTITNGPPATITTLTASASNIPFGMPVTWTATAAGGAGPLEYEFWRYGSATKSWSIDQAYSSTSSYTWTPSASDIGPCAVQARVRTAGLTVPFESALNSATVLVISATPVIVSPVTVTPASPAPAGTAITWTVVATGGSAQLEYQFWRHSYASASWTLVRDYAPEASYTWAAAASDEGTYALQVWVRSAGMSAAYEAYLGTGVYVVSGAMP